MSFLYASLLSIAILYAWGGICYSIFHLLYGGSDTDQRRFLERHYRFFTERTFKETYRETTPRAIREAGGRGWGMVAMPVILLNHGLTISNVLISTSVLFFGGLIFAYSWYGLRCLRMLGLDSYVKEGTDKPPTESTVPPRCD